MALQRFCCLTDQLYWEFSLRFINLGGNKHSNFMNWLRNILKGISLSSALFVFQACYGTPQWLNDVEVKFKLVSSTDNTSLKDVEISTRVYKSENLDWILCGYTDENGFLATFAGLMDENSPEFRFRPPADTGFELKDTVIANPANRIIQIKLKKAE